MAKTREKLPSVYDIQKYLKEDSLLPIFFFGGEDLYTIDNAVKAVIKAVEPFLSSDFDKEIITAEKGQSIISIIDIASAFPFGTGKKLLILKNFEKIGDRKNLAAYVSDPQPSTILVITQPGKIPGTKQEPYKTLIKNNYLFEARNLRGTELAKWLCRYAKKNKFKLSMEHAQALIDIVGEDKGLLEMQMQKIFDYLDKDDEITFEVIKKMSSTTREYSIFDLQDALGRGEKSKAIDIAYNLLDSGQEMVFIISMLTKFVFTVAQIMELQNKNLSDWDAAKLAGVSYYYYINCKKARYLMSHKKLINAGRALLEADTAIKTSSSDEKALILILISEFLR